MALLGTVAGQFGVRVFLFTVASVVSIALLSGCPSMVSSRAELQDVGANEGIVFGSFVVNVEKSQGSETGRAFPRERKADGATLIIREQGTDFHVPGYFYGVNPLTPTYVISATPEKEEVFIKKLPVGFYRIEKIQATGFGVGTAPLEFNLDVYFAVSSKLTTYIGKVTVQFPDRITPISTVHTKVTDVQRETTERLKSEHEISLSNVVSAFVTPLHDAAKVGNQPTTTELLGQNPRSIAHRDRYGYTALHIAVAFQQKDIAVLLLANGADANDGRNRDAVTPLHIAAGSGQKDISELLLANGANMHARNKAGQTPLVVADCKGQIAVAALLRAHRLKTESLTLAQRQDLARPSPC